MKFMPPAMPRPGIGRSASLPAKRNPHPPNPPAQPPNRSHASNNSASNVPPGSAEPELAAKSPSPRKCSHCVGVRWQAIAQHRFRGWCPLTRESAVAGRASLCRRSPTHSPRKCSPCIGVRWQAIARHRFGGAVRSPVKAPSPVVPPSAGAVPGSHQSPIFSIQLEHVLRM
jgi:hypothetical protein